MTLQQALDKMEEGFAVIHPVLKQQFYKFIFKETNGTYRDNWDSGYVEMTFILGLTGNPDLVDGWEIVEDTVSEPDYELADGEEEYYGKLAGAVRFWNSHRNCKTVKEVHIDIVKKKEYVREGYFDNDEFVATKSKECSY
jgi:hypothetical protein